MKKRYLNIALACVGYRCLDACEEALETVSYHIDTILSDDNASSSIYLHSYKRAGVKKIINDLRIYDAVFLVTNGDNSEYVYRCMEAYRGLNESLVCVCISIGESFPLCDVPCITIEEKQLSHTIARLFSACNLNDGYEQEIDLVLNMAEECTSIFKWGLSIKSFDKDWENRLDNIELDGATSVLAVIKSKGSLPLDRYDELSFALMSRLGEGIDISFETIIDEELKGMATLSLYAGYPKKVTDLDRTNYTKI
ncbi:MAG: hypothetical protein IJA82_05905 [Clostridia bacterium]|nr:hypothetical protein [Clostridia bacterium]